MKVKNSFKKLGILSLFVCASALTNVKVQADETGVINDFSVNNGLNMASAWSSTQSSGDIIMGYENGENMNPVDGYKYRVSFTQSTRSAFLTALKAITGDYSITYAQLASINNWDNNSGNFVYVGQPVFYKSYNSDPQHWYKESKKTAKAITKDNWKNQESIYTDTSGEAGISTGKHLKYSIDYSVMEMKSDGKLHVEGWAAQVNYTDTTGSNNKTAFAITEAGTKTLKTLVQSTTTDRNPTNQFIYNRNNPNGSAPSNFCPPYDAYMNRPHDYMPYSYSYLPSTVYAGCHHSYVRSGYSADIDFNSLFEGDSYNKKYNIYIVQSTGNGNNRIIHKIFSTRRSLSYTYTNDRLSGTVYVKGYDTVSGGTDSAYIQEPFIILMRQQMTSDNKNYVDGSPYFKVGNYKIVGVNYNNGKGNQGDDTLWYQLQGYGATAGYTGWVPETLVVDTKTQTEISFVPNISSSFYINYYDADNRTTKVKESTKITVDKDTKTKTIKAVDYRVIYNSTTNKNWTMLPVAKEPTNKDYTVTFNQTNLPDINYYYTQEKEVKIAYVNANTGKVIKESTEEGKLAIQYGETYTANFADSKYTTENSADGNKVKFKLSTSHADYGKWFLYAGTDLVNYQTDFSKVGMSGYLADIQKNKNAKVQTRTNWGDDLDTIYFYVFEPQNYETRHVRINSKGEFVNNSGTVTNESGATVTTNNGVYYTGQKVDIRAYSTGMSNRTSAINTLFQEYFFAGKVSYQRTSGSTKHDTNGDNSFTLGLVPQRVNTDERGNFAKMYYRKRVADPSASCTLGVGCETGSVNTGGIAGNPEKYVASLSGQYNWYLSKEASTNWKQSVLALSNLGTLGNLNVFAVSGLNNTISVGDVTKPNFESSYTGKNDQIFYTTETIGKRKVVASVGEGLSKDPSLEMKVSKNVYDLTNVQNISDVVKTNNYKNMETNASLNSKTYKSDTVQSSYSDAIAKEAGKDSTVRFYTTYEYTNTFRDVYRAGEGFESVTFTWDYARTVPDFVKESKIFEYEATTKVDHHLNEDASNTLKKDKDVVKTKVGILRNFNNYTSTVKKEAFDNTTSNASALYETFTKKTTITPTLKTQSKLLVSESLQYVNDVLNGKLSTVGLTNTAMLGIEENSFTYNTNGYNNYLVPDVDFNFRNVNETSIKGIRQKESTSKTVFENNNEYAYQLDLVVDKTSAMNATTGQEFTVNLKNVYGVLSDSGLLVESTSTSNFTNKTFMNNYYKQITGNDISESDTVLTDPKSYYYIPMDVESVLKKEHLYNTRGVLSNVGLSDINIAMDSSFKFDKYLVGETTDNTSYASYKGELSRKGTYTKNKVLLTSDELNTIKTSDKTILEDAPTLRVSNIKKVTNVLNKFLGFKNE